MKKTISIVVSILMLSTVFSIVSIPLVKAPGSSFGPPYFISTWNTTLTSSGSSDSDQIALPLVSEGTYNFFVDWGDGSNDTITTWNQAEVTHTYSSSGTYTLTISGTIIGWRFNRDGDRQKITDISNWGCLNVGNGGYYFYGCQNLVCTATDALNLTGTSTLLSMFEIASKFNGAIGNWDTSHIVSMFNMFSGAVAFNQPIDSWNTSSVSSMGFMFQNAIAFNQILVWDTSAVVEMNNMFEGATSFNGDSLDFNTNSVQNMAYMFSNSALNGSTSNIGSWDVSNVTNMCAMFFNDINFNQDLSSWDTGNVIFMNGMFQGARIFNQPLNSWDVSSVTNMDNTFMGAWAFNQPLDSWNTSSVTVMQYMFWDADSFNQDIGSWDITSLTNASNMFEYSTLSTANYDNLLIGWDAQSVQSGVTFDGGNSKYAVSSPASVARVDLVTNHSWSITDGGAVVPFTGSGSGTAGDPYQITNADELNQTGSFLSAYWILMNDINLNDYGITSWNGGEGFIPIGNYDTQFTGSFDGQNYTITNLFINRPSTNYQGLFGYVTTGCVIKNLGLTAVDVKGRIYTGGLVGYALTGVTITNCYTTGAVRGYFTAPTHVGGLIGYNYGSINDCYSTATVIGNEATGGIVGYNYGTITDCYSTGTITGNILIGGITGDNDGGTITNCYSSGTVSGTQYIGGIAGYQDSGTITTCHATGTVSGTNFYIAGIVGFLGSGTVSYCYSSAYVIATVTTLPKDSVAGIAGCIAGSATVSNCYSTGTITTNANGAGGIVGWNYGTVTNCYSTATITGTGTSSTYYFGGLAGYSSGTITNCYSAGAVTGPNWAGGLIGYSNGGTVTNSYWDTETSGQATSQGGTGRTTAQMTYDYVGYDPPCSGLYQGWDLANYVGSSSIWVHDFVSQNHGYPLLRWQYNTETAIYNGYPFNGSSNIPLQPICSVGTVSTTGIMNIIWQDNSTGDWVTRQIDTGVANGTHTWPFSQATIEGHTYYYRAFLDDGIVNLSAWYSFTTGIITISNVYPTNGTANIPVQPTCSVSVTSPSGNMNITWQWKNSTGDWITCQTNNSVGAGTYTWYFSQASVVYTTYNWRVFVDDGTLNLSEQYSFTTYLPYTGIGSGTALDPYQITNADELNQTRLFLSAYWILMNDIDLNDYGVTNWNDGEGFIPIGEYSPGVEGGSYPSNPFTGNFNGQDYTISHLYINRPAGWYQGLFATIGDGAVVQNVKLTSVDMTSDGAMGLVGDNYGSITNCFVSGTMTGTYYIAGIAGFNENYHVIANITDCHSSVDTEASVGHNGGIFGDNYGTVTNCYATGNATAHTSGYGAGGLGGWNYGTIVNCHSSGTVTGTSGSTNVGGLVGINYGGSIDTSYSTGIVIGVNRVGGLVGRSISGAGGTITNCYATGSATGNQYVGGLMGLNYGTITNCYSTGVVTASSTHGGLVGGMGAGSVTYSYWDTETSGQSHSAGGEGRTTTEMTYPYEGYDPPCSGLYETWDLAEYTLGGTSIWVHDDPQNGGYPLLRYEYNPFSGGSGTAEDPYQITNCEQLNMTANFLSAYFIVMNDIDMSACGVTGWNGGEGFIPIGNATTPFNGNFNGQNYTINHFYLNRGTADYQGMFSIVGATGVIKNLGLINIDVTQTMSYGSAGGIAGDNFGTITNCYSSGIITGWSGIGLLVGGNENTIANCHTAGTVTATDYYAGGIAGWNSLHCTITNSYSTANVTTSDDGGYSMSGGLVGENDGTITGCHSTGTVVGSYMMVGGLVGLNNGQYGEGTLDECYSTGNVTGYYGAGGLVGWVQYGTASITDCYATGDVTGVQRVGGLIGRLHGATVTNCYSIGLVTGSSQTGGLVGYTSNGGTVVYSYWNTETSGRGSSAGGTGRTTLEMTYDYDGYDPPCTGLYETWDLASYSSGSSIWVHDDLTQNSGYPLFRLDYVLPPSPIDIIVVTLNPLATISIVLNQSSWSPSATLNETNATATNWANLDNDGNVQVDVTVNASNTDAWTLTTAPGHNQFQLQYGIVSTWTDLTISPASFVSNLAYDQSQDFGLKIFMPTSSSTNAIQTLVITFTATAD